MLLDPFYGVFTFGKYLSRWLNRLLILSEGIGTCILIRQNKLLDLMMSYTGWAAIPLTIVAAFIAAGIINVAVRFVWNIILTFVYGTTDAETIVELRDRRIRRRRDRLTRRRKRQTADWTRVQIINSRSLDNQILLRSSSLNEKAAKGRKALFRL